MEIILGRERNETESKYWKSNFIRNKVDEFCWSALLIITFIYVIVFQLSRSLICGFAIKLHAGLSCVSSHHKQMQIANSERQMSNGNFMAFILAIVFAVSDICLLILWGK